MYTVSEELFEELGETLGSFTFATTDYTDPDYLSDGEWLDVFVELSNKLLANMKEGATA